MLLARKNVLADLTLRYSPVDSVLNNSRDNERKRREVRRAMTTFTSLKKLCMFPTDTNSKFIKDMMPSLPNV